MKRFNLIFAVAVVTAFVSAFIVERSRSRDTPLSDYSAPGGKVLLDPLEATRGQHELSGTVVSHAGNPAAGVWVHLRPVEVDRLVVDPMFFKTTDEDGRFELANLPAGRYEVVLLYTGVPNTQWDDFRMPLETEDEVRWTLPEPYPDLPELPEIVRADLDGGLALPGGIATDDWSLEGYEVVLLPAEGVDPWSGAFERRATTDANGSFRIEQLVAARYRIRVLPHWARGGSWPFLSDVPYDHEEAVVANGLLAVALDCGEITGALVDRDGRSIDGALVRVIEKDREEHFWPVQGSGGDDGFRIRDLPPGRYVVRVHTGDLVQEVEVEVESGQRSEAAFPPVDHRGRAGD